MLPLPLLTDENRDFWQGGAAGELRIHRCRTCRRWFHPPAPVCPECHSFDVGAEAASGRASVAAWTVNHQAWLPGLAVPYILGIVELEDAPDVRLMTRLVDCAVTDLSLGLPVEVTFEAIDDVWLPYFSPAGLRTAGGVA